MRATRGARNPSLQVVIMHALHVYSQHSFGLSLRMNEMHITQFDNARFDFLPSLSDHARFDHLPRENYAEHRVRVINAFGQPIVSPALPNLWLLLVNTYSIFFV